jgi:HEAT repeat protein
MGALVALEEALDKNPRILDPIVDDLTSLLFQEEAALRGDTAALLGKIGNPAAIPALRKAVEDQDPDVREAAEEALQSLEQ